jgi:pimeloyl-ACP methyl ester carboxylesterase
MGWPLEGTDRRGRTLAYAVEGSGPWLVVPWCNVNWFDFSDLGVLTRGHRVIVASPLGFGSSGRSSAAAYGMDLFVDDLLHVCAVAGADRFDVFGYSLTGALAARLACLSDRVECAVVGGFPLLGSYAAVREDVERLVGDPEVAAGVADTFDPAAALALYRDLAELPDGDLVDRRRCRMAAFWGEDDAVLQGFDSSGNLDGELRARDVQVTPMPGLGHDDMLLHLDDVLGHVSGWLRSSGR